MIVQAVWDSDSPLRQIPHFGPDMIRKCKEAGVTSVFDLLDLEVRTRIIRCKLLTKLRLLCIILCPFCVHFCVLFLSLFASFCVSFPALFLVFRMTRGRPF